MLVYIPTSVSTVETVSRLFAAKPGILATFESLPRKLFKTSDVQQILAENRGPWGVSGDTSFNGFLEFLLHQTPCARLDIRQVTNPRAPVLTRYAWGRVSQYHVGLSIKPNAYLSHGTAVHLHGLSNQLSSTIYVNQEQTPKPPPRGPLQQAGIDRAFSGKQRQSRLEFEWVPPDPVERDLWRFLIINGKHTNRLGVEPIPDGTGGTLDVTSLERTLIDIVVRPYYSGGVYQVLEAYRGAKRRASVDTIIRLLKELDYIYPFHQAIGFYMAKAGFEKSQYDQLRDLGMEFDFYLAHHVREREYDSEWRLHVPKGL
ncbi:MAG: hypothetical protein WD733_16795 [Bryobacterales bacterium]